MDNKDKNHEWFAILNPNAGKGKGKKDWNRISGILTANGIKYSVRFTERKGEATEFTRELIAGGYKRIISIGGDGTLNEIVNGIFTQDHRSPSEIILSMIPVGTGNDWGRMFGIPADRRGKIPATHTFCAVRFGHEDLQSGFLLKHRGKTFCGLHTFQGLRLQHDLGHDKNASKFFFISM